MQLPKGLLDGHRKTVSVHLEDGTVHPISSTCSEIDAQQTDGGIGDHRVHQRVPQQREPVDPKNSRNSAPDETRRAGERRCHGRIPGRRTRPPKKSGSRVQKLLTCALRPGGKMGSPRVWRPVSEPACFAITPVWPPERAVVVGVATRTTPGARECMRRDCCADGPARPTTRHMALPGSIRGRRRPLRSPPRPEKFHHGTPFDTKITRVLSLSKGSIPAATVGAMGRWR